MSLSIATWNMRRSRPSSTAAVVRSLDVDLLVVQELSRDDGAVDAFGASDVRWVGSDVKSQLAIFTFGEFSLSNGPDGDFESNLKWVLPVEVDGPTPFRLLGLWADNSGGYRPATAGIRHLAPWMANGPAVVAGDFNHHRKWDHQGYNERDHKVTSDLLARLGLVSAYHRSRERGEARLPAEDDPTFWMHHDESKPHHIDYIYAPAEAVKERADDVSVGSFANIVAAGLSDHAPVRAVLYL